MVLISYARWSSAKGFCYDSAIDSLGCFEKTNESFASFKLFKVKVVQENEQFISPLLALDVGNKRIGLARLAAGVNVAIPIPAVIKAQGRAEVHILEICAEHGIRSLLIGLPRSAENRLNPQCMAVLKFCRRLTRRNPQLVLRFIDEFLSSAEIEHRFNIRSSLTKAERNSGVIDSFVASFFIEEYIGNPGCVFSLDLESSLEAPVSGSLGKSK